MLKEFSKEFRGKRGEILTKPQIKKKGADEKLLPPLFTLGVVYITYIIGSC